MRRLGGLVAVLVLLTVAACDNGGTKDEAGRRGEDEAGKPMVALDRTISARTVRVASETVLTVPSIPTGSRTATGEGLYDLGDTRGQTRQTVTGVGSVDILFTPDGLYLQELRGPIAAGSTWLAVERLALRSPRPTSVGVNDPGRALDFLIAPATGVRDLGTEDLRGVETTHYRGVVHFTATGPQSFRRSAATAGLTELTINAWVDGDRRVRRVSYVVDFGELSGGKGRGRGRYSVDFFDFGVPVAQIEPPAPSSLGANTRLSA